MDKKAIFRVMSMIGMVLGAVGTLLSNWADDRGHYSKDSFLIHEALPDRKSVV